MATSLFKMPFDVERLKVQRIYASKELDHCSVETMSCDKIREIYGCLLYTSLYLIMGPVYWQTNDAELAFQIGLAAAFLGGFIEDVYKRQPLTGFLRD